MAAVPEKMRRARDCAPYQGKVSSLIDAFTTSTFVALAKYERGEFAVAPIECKFCAFAGCCRHYASQLSPDADKTEDAS